MRFKLINDVSEILAHNILYLRYIHYDDYGYCTTYNAYLKSSNPIGFEDLGNVKIGCLLLNSKVKCGTSQNGFNSYSVNEIMPRMYFDEFPDDFFSLGQSIHYYKCINTYFKDQNIDVYLKIKDLAYDFNRFKELYLNREPCLFASLMRDLHYANVEQFHRITLGDAELTRYDFSFRYCNNDIEFTVIPNSLPPTNIHVLIGRNGVGKTWLLYQMVSRILEAMDIHIDESKSCKYKLCDEFVLNETKIKFAGVIGMPFSVFDDGLSSISISANTRKPQERMIILDDFAKKYKYIGLVQSHKTIYESGEQSYATSNITIKSVDMLSQEFITLLNKIALDRYKKNLYLEMCEYLESDTMFKDNGFINRLEKFFDDTINQSEQIAKFFKLLSSGHMIIVLSLTALCESIFEKTIVFIDEPETHLHPPLLSTYIRTLSFLLRKRNAVGIIATHSPIVLQEVPKCCVTKVERIKDEMSFYRPDTETFASGTDQLTREIFGYEIVKTGFYKLLKDNVKNSFEETYNCFEEQIGFLGQIMIQGIINNKGDDHDEKD